MFVWDIRFALTRRWVKTEIETPVFNQFVDVFMGDVLNVDLRKRYCVDHIIYHPLYAVPLANPPRIPVSHYDKEARRQLVPSLRRNISHIFQ